MRPDYINEYLTTGKEDTHSPTKINRKCLNIYSLHSLRSTHRRHHYTPYLRSKTKEKEGQSVQIGREGLQEHRQADNVAITADLKGEVLLQHFCFSAQKLHNKLREPPPKHTHTHHQTHTHTLTHTHSRTHN